MQGFKKTKKQKNDTRISPFPGGIYRIFNLDYWALNEAAYHKNGAVSWTETVHCKITLQESWWKILRYLDITKFQTLKYETSDAVGTAIASAKLYNSISPTRKLGKPVTFPPS